MTEQPAALPPSLDEAALRVLLDAVPSRVWLLDAAHRVRWCNRRAAGLFGLDPEEVVGRPLEAFASAETEDEERAARRQALDGAAGAWRGWSTYRDGVRRYTERHFLPFRDGNGQIDGYVEFTSDLSALMAAEDQAQRSSRLLKDAIDSLPDGVGIEDVAGRLIVCNGTYAGIYGVPEAELIGQSFAARSPILLARLTAIDRLPLATHRDAAIARLQNLRRHSLAPVEISLADGRDILVQRALTGYGGRVVVMTDITQLRARERESEAGRQLLEDAIEAVALGFAIFDANGRLSLWNSRFAAMNAPGAVAAGVGWDELVRAGAGAGRFLTGPGGVAPFAAALARALAENGEPEIDLDDGRRVVVWRQPTRQGGAVVTFRDVTERRRMEAALRDAWALAQDVLEACPAPITMASAADGRVIYENAASQALFRCRGGPATHSTLPRWRVPADRQAFGEALERSGDVARFEGRFRRDDGSEVWLALAARRISHQGEPVFVTHAQDLTERRAQEAELARQRAIASQAEKLGALGELLAGVSHELNNPLSVLVGQAALLLETAEAPEVRRRAERIAEAADRCARIVRSFLALARQEPTAVEAIAVDPLIDEALQIAAAELRAAEVELVRTPAPRPAVVAADPAQLRQVFVNLASNAAQALAQAPRPRRLTVATTMAASGAVLVRVADTGPGVPAAIAGRIFEPLFTTKPGGKGAGLGLAICQRIVAAHGGRLALLPPETDGGATFEVELPRMADAAEAGGSSEGIARNGPCRVLVVDADPGVRRTTLELLEIDGHTAQGAGSAREAAWLIERAPAFDLVVCDVVMPETDGLGFYHMLRASRPETAARFVFAASGLLPPETARSLAATARPCLQKPLLLADLRRLLRDRQDTRDHGQG